MKNWRQFLKSYWQMLLAALVTLILIIIINAAGGSELLKGSSYSLEPQGYGAWYQKMVDKGVPIERWRKPASGVFKKYLTNTTLLQVNSQISPFSLAPPAKEWIEKGNILVILGADSPSHDIEFSQDLASPQGQIKIDTTRRFQPDTLQKSSYFNLPKVPEDILADSAGAVIWQSSIGKGKLILATTPYLAANAYQDSVANYDLLAALTTDRQRIVVDEYLHGYREPQKNKKLQGQQIPGDLEDLDSSEDTEKDVLSYLLKTPFLVMLINIFLVLGVLVWQQNRRFGAVVIPQPPKVDNSLAYIQALGGVLRQAQSSEFVVQNIGKAEQLKLQQHLGLGNKQLVDRQTLVDTWLAQTGKSNADLPLQLASGQKRLTEAELQQWLTKIQAMRDQLPRQSL
jgi:hypothetical protein